MKQITAIERILHQLETRSLDLTPTYDTWLKLGFAFSSLGESGRPYFHRVSRFHPGYTPSECDLQFSRCLESAGSGIQLATFFHMAKEAGIPLTEKAVPSQQTSWAASFDPEKDELEEDLDSDKLPTLPDEIFNQLPELLKQAITPAEGPEERDILFLGSLTVLSACLPPVHGIYDGMEVFSNLYLYVTAGPSSGKGKLNLCKRLVLPIHLKKRKEAEEMKVLYDAVTAEGDTGADKPEKPKEKMLLLPANSSATGVFQLLSDNEGRGLMFETEGDTLSNIFKTDFGNYSDGYRKCYHHETISYYRRSEREYVDIQSPCLSTVLSGTPAQVHGLIPSAENGLFSRFLFYHLDLEIFWKDTFRNKSNGKLLDHYHNLGVDFMKFHELLCQQPPIEVVLTEDQQERFYQYFRKIQGLYRALIDDIFVATVRRMGLNCFRFIMILTSLRHQGMEQLPGKLVCREEDFRIALGVVRVLLRHSAQTYSRLPESKEADPRANRRVVLLNSLPEYFKSSVYTQKARDLGFPRATAYRMMKLFIMEKLVIKKAYNSYHRPEMEDIWGQQFSGKSPEAEESH